MFNKCEQQGAEKIFSFDKDVLQGVLFVVCQKHDVVFYDIHMLMWKENKDGKLLDVTEEKFYAFIPRTFQEHGHHQFVEKYNKTAKGNQRLKYYNLS
jgi:hypothetical protein